MIEFLVLLLCVFTLSAFLLLLKRAERIQHFEMYYRQPNVVLGLHHVQHITFSDFKHSQEFTGDFLLKNVSFDRIYEEDDWIREANNEKRQKLRVKESRIVAVAEFEVIANGGKHSLVMTS